jgi:hypothetical protein
MNKRNRSVGLGAVRGGDLLRALAKSMKAVLPKPASIPSSADKRRKASPEEEELAAAFAARPAPRLKPIAAPVKRKQGPKKEILRVPKGFKLDINDEGGAAPEELPGAKPCMNDLGEAAFRKIAGMRARLEGFSASHGAPGLPSAETRELVARRVALGASAAARIADRDDGYFIGYDFGTSTTKVVLRFPNNPSSRPFAVPIPADWASSGQPHLWPTALWYDQASDRFALLPQEGCRCLEGFKSALIEHRGHRNCGGAIEMEKAAAAFLALHIAYVIGTALERTAALKIAGINFGVPVATMGEADTRDAFERIARVGLSLVPFATDLTCSRVRSAWHAQSEPVIPYALHAELSGGIAGYCKAPRHYFGGHMIIDCGSATLDMASFTLEKRDWPIGIYSARIEPLGADASLIYQAAGASADECRKAARYQEHEVFRQTLKHQLVGFAQDGGKFPYQVILIGGGIHSAVHEPLLQGMEQAFQRAFHRPQVARDLDYAPAAEPGRLILADGLARDPIDLQDVALPLAVPLPRSGLFPEMISKDQV